MKFKHLLLLLLEFLIFVMIFPHTCRSINAAPYVARISKQIHYDMYVSSDFDSEEVNIIEKAALEWDECTKHMITYTVYYNFDDDYTHIKKDGRSLVFQKLSKLDQITKKYDDVVFNHTLGYFEIDMPAPTIYIVADRMLGDYYYEAVVLHEMGHSLGLRHSDEEHTLMFASQDGSSKHITHSDIVAFCKLYGCNADQLLPSKK